MPGCRRGQDLVSDSLLTDEHVSVSVSVSACVSACVRAHVCVWGVYHRSILIFLVALCFRKVPQCP